MLRGLECLCDPEPFFETLPSTVDLTAYDWYIDDVELNYFYFRPGKYTGKDFLSSISDFFCLSFVRIQRFPLGTDEEFMKAQPMEKYEDFLSGACDLLILFYDGGFTEIYAKDEKLTLRMMDAFKEAGAEKLEAKYDHNDGRTGMHF
jgi:hypothetical protein